MVLFVTFSKFDLVTKINFLVKMWANTSQKIIPKQSALNDVISFGPPQTVDIRNCPQKDSAKQLSITGNQNVKLHRGR